MRFNSTTARKYADKTHAYKHWSRVVRYHCRCLDSECEWEHYSVHRRGASDGGSYRKTMARRAAKRHSQGTGHRVQVNRIEEVQVKYDDETEE